MSKKTEEASPAQENSPIDNRIAAVRDLIFGENIQQYNSEFQDVYNKINDLKSSTNATVSEAVSNLEGQVADLERLVDNKLQDMTAEVEKRLAELDEEKADRRKLGMALEKIAQMLQD
jgi:hypothetical protein